MAETKLPQRIDYPTPSMASGDLYPWLLRLTTAINEIPTFSFYSGNPNSGLTGNVGALSVNIASAATARLWVKESGTSASGWRSVATL